MCNRIQKRSNLKVWKAAKQWAWGDNTVSLLTRVLVSILNWIAHSKYLDLNSFSALSTERPQWPATLWSGVYRWASPELHWPVPRQHPHHRQRQRSRWGVFGLLICPTRGLFLVNIFLLFFFNNNNNYYFYFFVWPSGGTASWPVTSKENLHISTMAALQP